MAVSSSSDISVQFSTPLATDSPDPTLFPSIPGTWTLEGSTTLLFQPSEYLAPLSTLDLTVGTGATGPRGRLGQTLTTPFTTSFTIAAPSVLRLQQLLAELGYLPLQFTPSTLDPLDTTLAFGSLSGAPQGAASQSLDMSPIENEPTDPGQVTLDPQPGSFSWRYPNVPASLASLWQPGLDTVIVRGAVMSFEYDHGLENNGDLTLAFWSDLLDAVAAHQTHPGPYDYLEVSTSLPETLSVWRDGSVIFQSPANTGIPEAPTAAGTYPVYVRYASTTMSGFNPDGSHYDDPGVPDVAYFNGGDAVHGFLRGSYGSPQSLGCVELPYPAAAAVFGDDPIGTLVTIS
jgi:hypothetical protein